MKSFVKKHWLTFLVLTIASVAIFSWTNFMPLEILRSVTDVSGISLLLVLAGLYTIRSLLSIPGSFLVLFVGFKFGLVEGFPIALVGAIFTALPVYLFGRYSSEELGLLRPVASASQNVIDDVGDFRSVLGATLLPVPADPVSYAAGVGHVPIWTFIVANAIGEVPYMLLYLSIGASMRQFTLQSVGLHPAVLVLGFVGVVTLFGRPLYLYLKGIGS